ncbi:hypothetical protein BBF96_10195 [Anoxybacter fermentans]|uniref:ABC transporter domain-containing protein n=1 Tax=Anoxybacter fermentans TaxID=1323375 RepID=A0A3Q9HR07_9FIRM|nr:ABC-F family ATP-binding cassette domain-containing protein [Anoxybacter fermentans]AZR73721.1 hypothetical protein BBF96_10195 [Anoxybacter fermentans]
MALLELRNAYKSFINQEILVDVSFQIQPKERVGLIGPNGAGKSTLFKILMGIEELDQGELIKSSKATIGYLPQDFEWESDVSLFSAMLEVFSEVFSINDRLRELEVEMGKKEVQEDLKLYSKVMDEYSLLMQRYEELDGYSVESRVKGVLKGLGFEERDYQLKISQLSGGQKTRAGLARLLLTSPDLLLLDEPTNHLDLSAREWLEGFLKDYPGAMIIISHDRYFLDQIVTRILDLRDGELEHYPGNYSFYLKERKRRLLEWQREYQKQQEKIAAMEEYIRRNIAGVNSKQARGRRKQLARMERIKRPPMEPNIPKIYFTFNRRSGKEVLKIENLSKSYSGLTLFKNVNLNLYRGDKVGIVGPNGTGKTTFLKIILGQIEPDSGQVIQGTGVEISYFSQEHENLDYESTIIDFIRYKYRLPEKEARSLLARFLFTEDDVYKKIGDLSGGERSRLILAELSLKKGNLLILDEPTNHLDITSMEVLEEALVNFPGTILMVSHDRFFMERITNKIWELENGRFKEYLGSYSDYKCKKTEQIKIVEVNKNSETKEDYLRRQRKRNEEQSLKRRLKEVEKEIYQLEEAKEILAEELANPALYKRSEEEFLKINEEYQQICSKLEKLYEEWESLVL